jgi:hypothetical protein
MDPNIIFECCMYGQTMIYPQPGSKNKTMTQNTWTYSWPAGGLKYLKKFGLNVIYILLCNSKYF